MDRGALGLVGYSPWVHKESDTTERLIHTYLNVDYFVPKVRFLPPLLC